MAMVDPAHMDDLNVWLWALRAAHGQTAPPPMRTLAGRPVHPSDAIRAIRAIRDGLHLRYTLGGKPQTVSMRLAEEVEDA